MSCGELVLSAVEELLEASAAQQRRIAELEATLGALASEDPFFCSYDGSRYQECLYCGANGEIDAPEPAHEPGCAWRSARVVLGLPLRD